MICLLAAMLVSADAELNWTTYDHWRDYLQPDAEDRRWRQVAWRESFWEGVQDAQTQRKPVLLWTMNGHPMGCT